MYSASFVASAIAASFSLVFVFGDDHISLSGRYQVKNTDLMLEIYQNIFYSNDEDWTKNEKLDSNEEYGDDNYTLEDCLKFCTNGRVSSGDRLFWKFPAFNYCHTPPCPLGKDETKKHCFGVQYGIVSEGGRKQWVIPDSAYNHYSIHRAQTMVNEAKQGALAKAGPSKAGTKGWPRK